MQFGIEFEKQLLSTIISNKNYLHVCSKFIQDKYFSLPELNFIYLVYEYYNKNANAKANDFILKEEMKSRKLSDEFINRTILLHEELKELLPVIAGSEKAIIFKAKDYAQLKFIRDNVNSLKKLTDEGDNKKALELFKKLKVKSSFLEDEYDNYDIIDWHNSYTDRANAQKKLLESGIRPISTGFTDLDALMKGGYIEGDLFSIIAATNFGKSALSTHFCGYNADQNIGGIMFATEMHASRMAMRLDARHTYVDFERFKNYNFDAKEERKLQEYYEYNNERYKDLVKIISVKNKSSNGVKHHGISFDFIQNSISDLRSVIKNFRYAVVDCGSHVSEDEKYSTEKERLASISWKLDGLAEQEGVAIIATWQTNRSGATKANNESVGGAYEITQCSDWVLGINKSEKFSLPKENHEIPDEEFYEGGIEDMIINHQDDLDTKSFCLSLTKAREGTQGDIEVNALLNRMFYYEAKNLELDGRKSVL